MTEMVGRYFSFYEATRSDASERLGVDNHPSTLQLANIRHAAHRLDMVREYVGAPIIVSSWFRSPAVNRAVGGADSSAHMSGFAIDCRTNNMTALELCKAAVDCLRWRGVGYDQIIHGFGNWMHISFDPRGRGETLTIFEQQRYARGLLTRQEYS